MKTIYLLRDPRTGEPRYVGCTGKALERRLAMHVSKATRSEDVRLNAREAWIYSLSLAGLRPTIEPLATVPDEISREEEAIAIWEHSLRYDLLNAWLPAVRMLGLPDTQAACYGRHVWAHKIEPAA